MLAILTVFSCSGGTPDVLIGTYAIKEHGEKKEFIKVEKRGADYILFAKQRGEWLPPVVVQPVTKTEFEDILKKKIDVTFVGLGNDMIAIFKVPKGWAADTFVCTTGKPGTFVCNTGYWLATMVGPAELYKQ